MPNSVSTDHDNPRLSWKTFSQLKQILNAAPLPLFPDALLFLLIPLTVTAYLVGGFYLILAPGNLYNALVSENWTLFHTGLINYAVCATVVLLVKVIRGVLRESAANFLRKRLTAALHASYFSANQDESAFSPPPYYSIAVQQSVDNPDQRLVSDVRDFSTAFLDIVAGGSAQGGNSGGLLEASASIVFYSYQVYDRTSWYGIIVAYIWSSIVAMLSVFVINRTSPVLFRQEQLEADFRFAHAELRKNAEQVAFLRGAPFEQRKHANLLHRVVSNQWAVIYRHVSLNLVQYGFSYYMSIIMYVAIAFAVHANVFVHSGTAFSSAMTPGEKAQWVSQTGGIFIQLLYSFTMAIELGTAISSFVTNSHRVATLLDELAVQRIAKKKIETPKSESEPLIRLDEEQGLNAVDCHVSEGITAENLTIHLSSKTTVGPISFSLKKGEWILIDSPKGGPGSGKSTILRTLRGFWAPDSGSFRIPTGPNAVLFVPQIPYIPSGFCSLRELVMYPQECFHSQSETNRVESALQAVGWKRGHPRHMLDRREEWSEQLSPGESQLVAAARVIERKPVYAVMDEPTSSLDVESERKVLNAIKAAGISGLTVGNGQSLPALHDKIVSIKHSHE